VGSALLLGLMLASSGEDKIVRLWDVHDGKMHRIMQGHEMGCGQLLLIKGQRLLGSHDQTINLGYRYWSSLKNLAGTSRMGMVNCLYSDGKTLVSGGDDSSVVVGCKYWSSLESISGHSNGVWSSTFSPQGTMLASVSNDKDYAGILALVEF